MRAIDVRYNWASVHDKGQITEATRRLKNDFADDEITEEKIKDEMSHYGCPHAEWYTKDCPSYCVTCWQQEPYQYKQINPEYYEDREDEYDYEEEDIQVGENDDDD